MRQEPPRFLGGRHWLPWIKCSSCFTIPSSELDIHHGPQNGPPKHLFLYWISKFKQDLCFIDGRIQKLTGFYIYARKGVSSTNSHFYLHVLLEVANLLLKWLSTLTTFCHGKPLEIRFPARIRIKLLTHQTQALSAYIWEWPIVTNVKGIHRTLEPYAIFLSNNMTPTSSTS